MKSSDYSGTSTGVSGKSFYVGRVYVRCLDSALRLPYNFVVVHNGYHEFRSASAARKFARSL